MPNPRLAEPPADVFLALRAQLEELYPTFSEGVDEWTLQYRVLRSTLSLASATSKRTRRPMPHYSHQHVISLSPLSQHTTYRVMNTPIVSVGIGKGLSQDAKTRSNGLGSRAAKDSNGHVEASDRVNTRIALRQPTPPRALADPAPPVLQHAPIVSGISTSAVATYMRLMSGPLSAGWHARHFVKMRPGPTYCVGDWTVRLGVLEQTRLSINSNAATLFPGIVVWIQLPVGDVQSDNDDACDGGMSTAPATEAALRQMQHEGKDQEIAALWSRAAGLVRSFWEAWIEGLDASALRETTREVMMDCSHISEAPPTVAAAKEALLLAWSEVLRLKV